MFKTSNRLWISPFKGSTGAPTYFKDVAYTAFRAHLENLTLEQGAYLDTPTDDVYRAVCKNLNYHPDSITLSDNVQAHWIGKRDSDKLIVYFHGGGFCTSATPGLIEYLFDLQKTLTDIGSDTSIVVLGYSLAPHKVYPTQLKQAVSFLKYLVETKQKDPSKVRLRLLFISPVYRSSKLIVSEDRSRW